MNGFTFYRFGIGVRETYGHRTEQPCLLIHELIPIPVLFRLGLTAYSNVHDLRYITLVGCGPGR